MCAILARHASVLTSSRQPDITYLGARVRGEVKLRQAAVLTVAVCSSAKILGKYGAHNDDILVSFIFFT